MTSDDSLQDSWHEKDDSLQDSLQKKGGVSVFANNESYVVCRAPVVVSAPPGSSQFRLKPERDDLSVLNSCPVRE